MSTPPMQEMLEALKPFADAKLPTVDELSDGADVFEGITLGDLRRAREVYRALSRAGEGEEKKDGGRPLPVDRETLGRLVRESWVRWAQAQPDPKPSWLVPYDELSESDKEADRQIGETIARWTLIHDAASAALSAPPSPALEAEPVGWLYQPRGGATKWAFSPTRPDLSQGAYWTVKPVYAHPPASQPAQAVDRGTATEGAKCEGGVSLDTMPDVCPKCGATDDDPCKYGPPLLGGQQ